MKTDYRPKGFHTITPYFALTGATDFIEFLKKAFNAEELSRYHSEHGRIMHAELRIGDSIVEVGEAHAEWSPRRFGIHMYVENSDAVYQQAIAAGCKSVRPPTDQPYGDREGDVEDQWGNQWFIATRKAELLARMNAETAKS